MTLILLLVLLSQQAADPAAKASPTCELAGLVARPPAGWINIQGDKPPAGHRGCQMVLLDKDGDPVGLMRLRSVAGPAPEFGAKTEAALIATERGSLSQMNVKVGTQALWTRDPLPITDPFREARGAGYPATIEGIPSEQEVHILTFRDDNARYLISLVTATRRQAPEAWQRNTDDMGAVMRSFTRK